MDGSGSSGKKIVFKKGLLAPKSVGIDDLFVEEEALAPVQAPPEEVVNYQEEGEIFDQFYKLLANSGGVERIREIAKLPLELKLPTPRLTPTEKRERDARFQELAEVLAHQLYLLAQKQRETDLDLYLSAFSVVLSDKSPQDAKAILDRANEFFTEHYYTAIRDRGERPEISHQIIKRVGHEDSDRITCISLGMNVERVAETLWSLHHGAQADKAARIADILLDLTESQLLAIRDEFLLIPYKILAKQAYAIIHSQSNEQAAPQRRSIGKGEVHDQKRKAAFQGRDDIRALRYLFLGRSVEEMALIRRLYSDLSDPEKSDLAVSLDTHIEQRFSPVELERLGECLRGWSPHQEASEINSILYPDGGNGEIVDTLSDPRDTVDRDHTQGIGVYLRKFNKNRVLRNKTSVYHRVLNSFEVIAERVATLSSDRFIATNQALSERFGYSLDPTMFPSLAEFDPRRLAMVIGERMKSAGDFFEIVTPMFGLSPRECLAVQQAYLVLYGVNLSEAIESRLRLIKASTTISSLVDRYVNGTGRVALNQDVLARYRGEGYESGVWQWEYVSRECDEQAAIDLAGLMDQEGDIGQLDRPIYDFLRERSYDQLNRIERAFFDLTEPRIPLREALRGCLSSEMYDRVELVLAGVSSTEIVGRLFDNPSLVTTLSDLAPSLIRAIRQDFESARFVSLERHVLASLSGDEDRAIAALAVVLTPEVYTIREAIRRLGRDVFDQVDDLRVILSESTIKAMAFERGFDTHFSRLRVHLKLAAARLALSPAVFSELMLYLEGVDPEVTGRLLEYFDAVDIDQLLATLRHYKYDQRIIEETFDLIHPDTGLRRAIKEMKVDLDLINETLLHLEGHSAKDVAGELHGLMANGRGAELGVAILTVLAPPTPQYPNRRIPEDLNWMDEMFYQVLLAYQRDWVEDLLDICWERGVPPQMLEELTARMFGLEVCASAREIFGVLKAHKEGEPVEEHAEHRICSYVESRGVRFRGRLVRAYNSFWARQAGFESLLDDVEHFFRDSVIRKKMHSLLLGVAVEPRIQRRVP